MRLTALIMPFSDRATAKLTVALTVSGTMPLAMADSTTTVVVWGVRSIVSKRLMSGSTKTRPPR